MPEDDEPAFRTRRRGKIAQCPRAIREEICRRLDDGETGLTILPWVNAQPAVLALIKEKWEFPISDNNLSEWFKGGFLDWQKKQTEVERTQGLAEFSLCLAKAAGGSMSEGVAAVAAGKVMAAMEGAKGEELLSIVDRVVKLRGAELSADRAETQRGRLGVAKDAAQLDRERFQRETAALFLKWYADQRAQEIAASADRKEIKMDSLIELMFGPRPEQAVSPPG